jgi:ribosomal protein L40E
MSVDNNTKREQLRNLIRVSISFAITLIVLAIIRAVVLRLPHMDEMVSDFLTISDIVVMVISVIFIVVIIVFGKILAGHAVLMLPIFPGIGSLINNIVILISIIIAYVTFDIVIMPFFRLYDISWLYPVIFLVLALIPIARIIYVFYTNSGNIAYLFRRGKTSSSTSEIICNNCGTLNSPGSAFCFKCGQKIEKTKKNICSTCGAELEPGSEFCSNCGSKVERLEKKEEENVCKKCGAELEPGSEFCSNCGEKTEKS